MAINYSKVGWDTTKFVNPTNMNQMDNGIKSACDGVDEAREKLSRRNLLTFTDLSQIGGSTANTVSELFELMPTHSILKTNVTQGSTPLNNSLPNTAVGQLVIEKETDKRGRITFSNYQVGIINTANYYNKLGDWEKVTLNSDLADYSLKAYTLIVDTEEYGNSKFGNDLFQWTTNGVYSTIGGQTLNVPGGTDGWGTVFVFGKNGYIVQLYRAWNSGNRLFFRCGNSNWLEFASVDKLSALEERVAALEAKV